MKKEDTIGIGCSLTLPLWEILTIKILEDESDKLINISQRCKAKSNGIRIILTEERVDMFWMYTLSSE